MRAGEDTTLKMPVDSIGKLWRFPDHKDWIHTRINSQNKRFLISDLQAVLLRCGMVDKFKEGPFGCYLELVQPLVIHGMLIYNLLKKEIILPNQQKDDEMWFGLGRHKARFGREEFCLCSGLNMGPLPEDFKKKKKGFASSLLSRYFNEKRPSGELLFGTFKQLTDADGEDALKMAYLLMVTQFFGTEEARKAIPAWLFTLVEDENAFNTFSWGSYIHNFTMFWLKGLLQSHITTLRGKKRKKEDNGHKQEVNKEENEGKKKKKKNKVVEMEKKKKQVKDEEVVEKEEMDLSKVQEDAQKNNTSTCHTINIFGFPLPFQVWAVERIVRLVDVIGQRISTGFPRFTRWNFDTRVVKIETKFSSGMDLFPWKVHKFEEKTEYYKSLVKQNVGSDEDDDDVDEGAASFHNQHTTSVMRSKSSFSDLNSKRQLFKGDFETPKSKFQIAAPSTVAELYSAVAKLIQESEERVLAFSKDEFANIRKDMKAEFENIRKEMKAGEKPAKQSTLEKLGANKETFMDMDGSKENDDIDFDMDNDGNHGETVIEVEKEKSNVSTAVHLEKVEGGENELEKVEGGDDQLEKVDGGDTSVSVVLSKDPELKNILQEDEIEKIINSACLASEMLSNDVEKVDPENLGFDKLVKHPILVDEYPSPAANVVVPNPNMSVVALDGPHPNVLYKDIDKVRAQRRSRYIRSPWTNPMPMRKKRKAGSIDELSNNVEFMEFLKGKDHASVYTGQIIPMDRTHFNELLDSQKWLSTLHIDSYLDLLWRRRSTPKAEYNEDIALVPSTFFHLLNLKWKVEMDKMDKQRAKDRKKVITRAKKKKVETPPDVRVWEEYPEFNVLEFVPCTELISYVQGHDLTYEDPWWKFESLLIPCNSGGHWMICHVFPKEGKVELYDSFWGHHDQNYRLKDIRCLLYLLPSILKHSGYYEELNMTPSSSAFTAINVDNDLIPQQDDGNSCGVFMLKYAELLFTGIPLPWILEFSQKDIPSIRRTMALEFFTNGQFCNSP